MSNSMIGASQPRHDALSKVTGAARYPADLVQPSMLQLQVVFAHRPHARILSIDTGAALRHPGVVAVLTAEDVPHNAYGLIAADQPVLCGDVVRFEGDKVALVIAENKAAAQAGAQLVRVEYEDLPRVTDARAALAKDAPLVHQHLDTNLLYHIPLRKGSAAQALAEADIVLEETFTTSWQSTRSYNRRPVLLTSTRRDALSLKLRDSGCTKTDARLHRCFNCRKNALSSATPLLAGPLVGAKTSRCNICWRWQAGSCNVRPLLSGVAKNRSWLIISVTLSASIAAGALKRMAQSQPWRLS